MTPLHEVAHIVNVPVDIEVLLDRHRMRLSQILALHVGSVLETSRSAGENIDIYIGSKLVGFGEIVIIENTMGFRITDFNIEE